MVHLLTFVCIYHRVFSYLPAVDNLPQGPSAQANYWFQFFPSILPCTLFTIRLFSPKLPKLLSRMRVTNELWLLTHWEVLSSSFFTCSCCSQNNLLGADHLLLKTFSLLGFQNTMLSWILHFLSPWFHSPLPNLCWSASGPSPWTSPLYPDLLRGISSILLSLNTQILFQFSEF